MCGDPPPGGEFLACTGEQMCRPLATVVPAHGGLVGDRVFAVDHHGGCKGGQEVAAGERGRVFENGAHLGSIFTSKNFPAANTCWIVVMWKSWL